MSGELEFYKSLGYELMKELAESISQELIVNESPGVYQTLELPNDFKVRFTRWRGGEMPYYIVLFDMENRYVFELDLSMIAHVNGKFTWHLKKPTNSKNKDFLNSWLNDPQAFDEAYSQQVTQIKATLKAGTNTPKQGYLFVEHLEWPELCGLFIELMNRAISAHSEPRVRVLLFTEAKNDDGSEVIFKRKSRRNQAKFRLNLMELYKSACAITGESVAEVLDAAHIDRHADTGINHSDNGLLLRSDVHRLFDANLIGIEPSKLKVVIAPSLVGTTYEALSGNILRSRVDKTAPSKAYINTKWNEWKEANPPM